MELIREKAVFCPYCGESFSLMLDCSVGSHQFIQDCEVCCRPILFLLEVDWEGCFERLEVRREDD